MANADGPIRLAEEAQPLLGDDDNERSSHPGDNIEGPAWFQRPLRVYHAARAAALQLGNINVLLVFVPLGLAAGAFNWSSISTSIFNFLAIIPLSAVVSDSSDKLSDEFGDLLGALINATFGNAVELIVILR
jgi:Ca2+:H+ antiporter